MAAVLLSSVGAFAQNEVGSLTLQPKVGLNLANITKFDNTETKLGLAAGAEFEYQATDLLSISAGVLYSKQGCDYKDMLVSGYGEKNMTTSLDYINVPILANVYVVKGLAVKLGLQPSFLVGANNKSTTVLPVVGEKDATVDIKDNMNTFDLSLPVGVSYEYNNFVLDARYNMGLTKMFKDNSGFNTDAKNDVFQFTLGYKFSL